MWENTLNQSGYVDKKYHSHYVEFYENIVDIFPLPLVFLRMKRKFISYEFDQCNMTHRNMVLLSTIFNYEYCLHEFIVFESNTPIPNTKMNIHTKFYFQ